LFYGAIFKENKDDLTTVWQKKRNTESKTISNISRRRIIISETIKILNGSVYGYIDYLQYVIQNIGNKFMPIDWRLRILKQHYKR
jgi:hypothetical protein